MGVEGDVMSAPGTKLPIRDVRSRVAFGRKADIIGLVSRLIREVVLKLTGIARRERLPADRTIRENA
jgi:hypothetical protein